MPARANTALNRLVHGAVIAALAALVAMLLVLAAVPPVDRDALTHHLAVPKLYLKYGGIHEIPHVPFSYYPMNLDLLYLIPLAFGNDIAPKYIHFAFALLTAGLIFSYLRRRLDSRLYGMLGGLLFLSLPVIIKLSVTVYVDLGLIFFSTASLLQLLRWSETNYRLKHLVQAGIFAGLCLGTKPNGMLPFFFLTLAIPFLYRPLLGNASSAREDEQRRHPQRRKTLSSLGWSVAFAAIAMLVYSPWMIRNFTWTGNPVYPMAQHFFSPVVSVNNDRGAEGGEAEEPSVRDAADSRNSSGFGHFAVRKIVFGESLLEILAIPLRIFIHGQDDNPRLFDGQLNPYLLVFPLLALLAFKGRNRSPQFKTEMRVMGMFALLNLLFAFFLVDMRIRYVSPIIPPLVILSVIGIDDLARFCRFRFSGNLRTAAIAAFGVSVLVMLALNGAYLTRQFSIIEPLRYLNGEVSRDEYIQKYRPEYAAISFANRHLPLDARILVLFNGNRIYYIDRETISSTELFRSLVNTSRSPENVRDELVRQGISHLLVRAEMFNPWVDSQFGDREKRILQALFQQHFKSLYQGHGYALLQVIEG